MESFPHEELEVAAWIVNGLIMPACHKKYKHLQRCSFIQSALYTEEEESV
ncbi:hypothetical protein AAHE18_05G215800 [Arachis hypogaea]